MPLKKGKAHHIISGNIKELVAAGHDPKQAVAIALSHSRKFSEGGEVEEEDMNRSIGEINDDGVDYGEKIANPEQQKEDMGFAKMIRMSGLKDMDEEGYAMGGLVEGMEDGPLGNKPNEDMDDSTEEPMSAMPKKMADGGRVDAETMKLIEEKKKKRRYASM